MARCRVIFIIVVLFMVAGSALSQTSWKRVSSFTFDWDGHKDVQLVLEIPATWSDPGNFTRIRIYVPGQKEFTLSNEGGWVRHRSEEASSSPNVHKTANVVRSQYVLVSKVAESRTALLLFGYSYASSPGSLDVIEISGTGQPRVVLHREELGLKDVRDLDGDGVAEIIGYPCLSQGFGNGLLTYDPFNVYHLGAASAVPAKLSLPLSKSYNIKHYYGWAGAQCSEEMTVVLHPPKGGKPIIVPTEQAERMTGSNP